jgi:hypothetical protein
MLRGEYPSTLSKRGMPAAARRNEAAMHIPSTGPQVPLPGMKRPFRELM